ncbi:Male gamete fusion factor [Musa troglodytarum]|uniref:Male gamete fusion factor n=1 Tax=Musa troglodytarum TaxID=320322 RepID=A0A9E7E910_9LILI|nr:Male gamete fusion factor [Musa troglodytarum]
MKRQRRWSPAIPLLFRLCLAVLAPLPLATVAVEILSKSKLERCIKASGTESVDCEKKIVLNMAVPSGSSGGEASIVAELVEVEENDTQHMQTIRSPPIITIKKSAAYAVYELIYIREVTVGPENRTVLSNDKFLRADQNRIGRNQPPQYMVERRSPGKILSIKIPTFEALSQFGTATITTKNIGELEASYSLTFHCLSGVSYMAEQFFIMKPDEEVTRSFYIYPTTDQAARYQCAAILKGSDFSVLDQAECQFTTTATVLENGSQIVPADELKKNEINSFFDAIKGAWSMMWSGLVDFFTGKTCSCHIQYVCVSWIVMFGLLLASLPTGTVLLWLLHQKGFFDPIYDWWDDRLKGRKKRNRINSKHAKDVKKPGHRHQKENDRDVHHKHKPIPSHDGKKPKSSHTHRVRHEHIHLGLAENDRYHRKHDTHLHLVRHKHKHSKSYLAQSHKSNKNRPTSTEMGDMKHKITRCSDEKDSRHKHVYHQLHGANSHAKHDKDLWN